jgi:hypothetical protein
MEKAMLHLNLVMNAFAVFGLLFLLFAITGISFFESSQYVYATWFLCAFSTFIYYVIFFLSFIYLKLIVNFYKVFDVRLVWYFILVFILLSYLIFLAKLVLHDFFAIRIFFGGANLLWLLTPLIILKALKRKYYLLLCGWILLESLVIHWAIRGVGGADLDYLALGTSAMIILCFPFFVSFLNKINFSFHLGQKITFLLSSLLFIPGVLIAFCYVLFY